jgi:glycogen debranching enzyme
MKSFFMSISSCNVKGRSVRSVYTSSALWVNFYYVNVFVVMDSSLITSSEEFSPLIPDVLPYLRLGDRVLQVEFSELKTPLLPPDGHVALLRLTKAATIAEVGEHGPPVAGAATEENEHLPHLRLFETLFGRDSLIVSTFLLPQFPKLSRATILALLKLQGVRTVTASEEEPGRILHEYRDAEDPMGQILREKEGWEFPYYGSVDATPLLVNLIVAYCVQEGTSLLEEEYLNKDGERRIVLDGFDAALRWIINRMDANNEGFLEFHRSNPSGIPNQVWKDSVDSYFHADGTLANHEQGIASIEVQGYVYDALLSAMQLGNRVVTMSSFSGRYDESYFADLSRRAVRLRRQVMESMWVEDPEGGYFGIGTDRDNEGRLRVLKVRASNMGHLLHSQLLDGDDEETQRKRAAVIDLLFSPDFLTASGIRTLSKKEPRFYPGAYHNGTVWLWDTYMTVLGLKRHGEFSRAEDLEVRMWSVVEKFKKFPEFARGGDAAEPELSERIIDVWSEEDKRVNRLEQPPQEIQAWTVAAMLASRHTREESLSPYREVDVPMTEERA